MKIIWEPSDIKAGRRAKKPGTKGRGLIIAYNPNIGHKDNEGDRWAQVSLDDGCIMIERMTTKEMAQSLTNSGDWPVELLASDPEVRQ